MKQCILIFLIILSCNYCLQADCISCIEHKNAIRNSISEKIYVSLDQVFFQDSQIYLQLSDTSFAIPAIYTDQQGYYVLNNGWFKKCKSWEWECSNCGNCNSWEYYKCPSCGAEVPDD